VNNENVLVFAEGLNNKQQQIAAAAALKPAATAATTAAPTLPAEPASEDRTRSRFGPNAHNANLEN